MIRANIVLGLAVTILISGCAAPAKVVKIGPDSYALSIGAMGIEGGEAAARNNGLAKAAEFCAERNRQLNLTKMARVSDV